MGRKPYKWQNLPRGMRARPRGDKIYYTLDTGGKPRKEISLGTDYMLAIKKYAELTMKAPVNMMTFAYVADQYWKLIIPGKAPRTQNDNAEEKKWLMKFFDNPPAPLDLIEPSHIRQYLDWRVEQARMIAITGNETRAKQGKKLKEIPQNIGHVRANREKALFSHIWNFAREYGYTKNTNPCDGVKSFKESGRDVYVSDDLFNKVLEKASQPLQYAMRLAYLTGQRPSDVIKISLDDMHDGFLHVRQGKTKAKLRIVIEGGLASLLDEIIAYRQQKKALHDNLLIGERGNPFTRTMLRDHFNNARTAAGIDFKRFQFKDLRAKAATELDDEHGITSAQSLLGHTTQKMTVKYVRHTAGKIVNPLELRKISANEKRERPEK